MFKIREGPDVCIDMAFVPTFTQEKLRDNADGGFRFWNFMFRISFYYRAKRITENEV